uniref:GEEIIE1 protein n=1 Tax=Tectona grandis TaxID=41396 RepID=A0A2Z4K4X9_TECGR|nr:GEEIIE1 protein [Tectona grandis]
MKKKLKDELESKNTVQEYICPNCSKRYTALDALRLISPYDEYFHCESCNGVLVAESDKLAAQELGNGDDNASRGRHDKLKHMLTKMEVCPFFSSSLIFELVLLNVLILFNCTSL